jgi:hypothetical protein
MAGAARAYPRPRLGSRFDRLNLLFLPVPPICRIMVYRAVLRELRRAPPRPAMAGAMRDFPRPRKVWEWVRLFSLFIPVSLDLVTEHHSALLSITGELLAVEHGGAAANILHSGGPRPWTPPPI